MSVEIPSDADQFGDSRLHAYIIFSDRDINWLDYGIVLGRSNGCPKPKTNMDKVGPEQYCRDHAPLNVWWSCLVNEVAEPLREQNPALVEDMVSGCEEVSPAAYDENCVSESYLAGKQYGLARESAYLLTEQLVEVITVAQETKSDVQAALFGQIERLEELIQDQSITTTTQLWNRYSHHDPGHCGLFYHTSPQE